MIKRIKYQMMIQLITVKERKYPCNSSFQELKYKMNLSTLKDHSIFSKNCKIYLI